MISDRDARLSGWLYCSLARATFALEVNDGMVTAGPPYARRWVGMDVRTAAWDLRRGKHVVLIFHPR